MENENDIMDSGSEEEMMDDQADEEQSGEEQSGEEQSENSGGDESESEAVENGDDNKSDLNSAERQAEFEKRRAQKRKLVKCFDRIQKNNLKWETLQFTWEEEFNDWKTKIEQETGAKFTAGERCTNKDGFYQYFSCDHSKSVDDADSGHESDELPCPAEMILLHNPKLEVEKHFTAQYQSIHIGHDTIKSDKDLPSSNNKSAIKQSDFAAEYQSFLAKLKESTLTKTELNQLEQALAKIKAQKPNSNGKRQEVEEEEEEEEEEDEKVKEVVIPTKKAKKVKTPKKKQRKSWSMEMI